MEDPKSKLEVTIIKSPLPLSPEEEADLRKKLESTLIHFFPELHEKGEMMILIEPRFRSPK
jgi:hypothetical protein